MAQHQGLVEKLDKVVRQYPDFPQKGILFRDVHPIMSDPAIRKELQDYYATQYQAQDIDVVVGLDSRGYYFGVPLADRLNVPFVPIRKGGKLPGATYKIEYAKEYGKDSLEIQIEAIKPGQRVVVLDDLLATGGTIGGACQLLEKVGAVIVACEFVIELVDLDGKKQIPQGVKYNSLLKY
ncbi:putative adenine phosphoribosyltransferase [Planoprotostelium fungivorum]|uniref:adenine phosphoribosyltransferase n=1 Tax=Planoprotostelium fungivorum TaxID=1890364 RepID=A0A2P6NKV6_9EUKA|nr:putative adenine phosphoribosyltransferase [Planoprotostelium fungivorum]